MIMSVIKTKRAWGSPTGRLTIVLRGLSGIGL